MFEYGFMLLDPSSTFESVRENIGFLRTILADGCLPVTFCRMLPYDGTPIKDELVRTGRLRGDVCNPDYDFLDPRIGEFYQALTELVSLTCWIHGLEAVTIQLGCAWHEVAVMERLFPALSGFNNYKDALREITKRSNDLLLRVVEDLSYQFFRQPARAMDSGSHRPNTRSCRGRTVARARRLRLRQRGDLARDAGKGRPRRRRGPSP
ncbi:MAG: hypothetical protein LC794_09850 [Acidobacteria bacterium]|nr:hypothetical protein [Acidobacteriota bacterium]